MNIAISYGTYYQYLRPKAKSLSTFNVEAEILTFNDGEIAVEFSASVRGKHVFIFGDTTHYKTELEMTVDAARRSSAAEITVIMPYYGYARQDKKGNGRASIGASVIAHILQSLGVNRIVAIDLHAEQIQGYFQIPFEHISGKHIMDQQIADLIASDPNADWVFASPDAGGTPRVKKVATRFKLLHVVMNKHRDKPGSIESMEVIGNVKGKKVILIDDLVDTAGTLVKSNEHLKAEGAIEVYNFITHPVLSDGAIKRIEDAGVKLITSNTRNTVTEKNKFIEVIDCADILNMAIFNIANNQSIITTLTQ